MSSLDLTALRVIAAKDIDQAASRGRQGDRDAQGRGHHPAGADAMQRRAITVRAGTARRRRRACSPEDRERRPRPRRAVARPTGAGAVQLAGGAARSRPRSSPSGKKLWHRQYVDGNGGNISYRIGPNEVLCTPTLCSKFDLTPEHICMVDLDGNQLAGTAAAHERDLPAPRDLQGRARGEGRRALPPAARDGVRDHRPRAALGHHPRVRRVRRGGGAVAVRDAGHPAVRRDGAAVRARTTTPCCWGTTASSAGPTR